MKWVGVGRWIRTAWLMLGITLLLFVAAEGALSLLYRYRDSRHPNVDYRLTSDAFADSPWAQDYFREDWEAAHLEWHPYVYWHLKPYRGNYVNVDAEGIRRTLPAAEGAPSSNAVDIFMFGGSTMWGNGARDDHTIASALARMLRERGVACDVTNFGESGYVSTQELITLTLQLRKGNVPDVVVFYDGVNDAYSAWQQGVPGIPQNEQSRVLEFNMSNPKRRAERTQQLLREYATGSRCDVSSHRFATRSRRGIQVRAWRSHLPRLRRVTRSHRAWSTPISPMWSSLTPWPSATDSSVFSSGSRTYSRSEA